MGLFTPIPTAKLGKAHHQVTLTKDFYMGRNEAQVDSFKHFVNETKRRGLPRKPVPDDFHGGT